MGREICGKKGEVFMHEFEDFKLNEDELSKLNEEESKKELERYYIARYTETMRGLIGKTKNARICIW